MTTTSCSESTVGSIKTAGSQDDVSTPPLGEHWLLECYGPLANLGEEQLKVLMLQAAAAGGATVLMCHMHQFLARPVEPLESAHQSQQCGRARNTQDAATPTTHHLGASTAAQKNGVTGVVLLAESHITVHTWPEHDYAAFDIFMCQSGNPQAASSAIQLASPQTRVVTRRIARGVNADCVSTNKISGREW